MSADHVTGAVSALATDAAPLLVEIQAAVAGDAVLQEALAEVGGNLTALQVPASPVRRKWGP